MRLQPSRQPDFEQFDRILRRRQRPDHLPLYEHIASGGFIAERMGVAFDAMSPAAEDYWRIYVEFWMGLGFDGVPLEIPFNIVVESHQETAGKASVGSEAYAVIRTMEDFERFPWPDESTPIDFSHFERAARHLPEGARIVGGVCAGPYEWVSKMMGVEGLAVASCADPDLVAAMFDQIGRLHTSAVRQLADMDFIGALRQGDDLGFKTSTFLPPEDLRRYIFPIYTRMAEAAHARGKCFILHSCGNLNAVYDDLIDDVRIDAKHSFEDTILPVTEFKKHYGRRVTPLGGLDVDRICQLDEAALRAYTRSIVEQCFEDGFWALGTGNSLTNYMPVRNYLIVLDEGLKVAS